MTKNVCLLLVFSILIIARVSNVTGDQTARTLAPSVNKYAWFQTHNPHPLNSQTFGAFTLEPVGEALYIGFNAGAIWDNNGAAIGRYNPADENLSFIGNPDEQGVTVLFPWQGTLQIPGSDLCCPDSWEMGNHYVLDTTTDSLTKYRQSAGLERVIHSTDMTSDGNLLYLSANKAPTVDTREAAIWKSADGSQWEQVAVPSQFRIHSLEYINGRFWATVRHERYGNVSLISSADLKNWQPHLNELDHSLMTVWQNGLLVLSKARHSIHFVHDDTITTFALPGVIGVLPDDSRTRADVTTTDGHYVYAIVSDGQQFTIQKSNTLRDWDHLHTIDGTPSVLEYWPSRHSLVYGTQGENGDLFEYQLPVIHNIHMPLIANAK